jgi:hypothetical protein
MVAAKPTPAQEILAGTFAGVVDALVVHPVDVVKTQTQLSRGRHASMLATARAQIAQGGVGRLYRGVLPVMLRPTAAAMYSGNEWARRAVVGEGGTLTTATAAAAGFLSGILEAAVVTPYEVVKVRMMSVEHLGRYTSSLHCARAIVAQEGLGALLTGLSATCARNCPFNGLYFGLIFTARRHLPAAPRSARQEFCTNLLLGCVAGGVSTCAIAPFDVVKSRMQNQLTDAAGRRAEYRGTLQTLSAIVRSEGVGALYRGFAPLLTKVVISCGVSFASFTFALDSLAERSRAAALASVGEGEAAL